MSWSPISEMASNVRAGRSSAADLVEQSFAKVEETTDHNLFISLNKKRALKRAIEIDEKVKAGKDPGKLAGVPFIAKDNFLTLGTKTTAASNILKDFEAPYQATAIELLEAQGAICI